MDETSKAFYELRFRTAFLEAKAAAFQDLFVAVMSKAHPADFMACRPWGSAGDRKNDGYLKSERTLFQVYAPNELRAADTLRKIQEDFTEALPYWQEYFDTWVFVHNATGGLPPDVIAKLLALEEQHKPIRVIAWGYDELLLRFRLLDAAAMRALYGAVPRSEQKHSEARRKLRRAQELVRSGDHSEAVAEMTQALARDAGNDEEEVEILLALAITSSDHRGHSDREHYFAQAEKKVDRLKSSVAKAIYFRARAGTLERRHDQGAEQAYRDALHVCTSNPEDERDNLATQACIIRASFVHFLCNEHRLDDAERILTECEAYARAHKDAEDGELLQAALEAGIHYALERSDHDGVGRRITELEQSATSSRIATRIAGELIAMANRFSHRDAPDLGRLATEAAIRLARRCDNDSLLPGCLYTEAMLLARAGAHDAALAKARALLALCRDDAPITYAVQNLIAEMQRLTGNSQEAVELQRRALAVASGGPDNIAFAKIALARALNDNGATEEALQHARDAWHLLNPASPPDLAADVLSHVVTYTSQLGAHDETAEALAALQRLPDEREQIVEMKQHANARAAANAQLRQRFIEVLQHDDPATAAGTNNSSSLAHANALVVKALLECWDDMPEAAGGSYDFWARGNFGRLLLNARCFPNTFNITLEVRTLDDVKRAIRLWGLYADFLMLLWKGPSQGGLALVPVPAEFEGPGGWGYMICAGSVVRKEGTTKEWYPALAQISMFPDDVATFLATEARPFIQAGRLIVVPAVAAGCINPGHGPFEQLLAEAANAIPSIRWKGGTPIAYMPHAPTAPFELLAELAELEADRLRQLRLLLLQRSRTHEPSDVAAKTLALELDNALRELAARTFTRKRLDARNEPVNAGTARFRITGERLGGSTPESPYAPLLLLQNLGYGWRIEGTSIPRFPERFEPQPGDAVGSWLAPPTVGWTMPSVRERIVPE